MIDVLNFILKYENSEKIAYVNENDKITYKDLIKEAKKYSDILKKKKVSKVILFGHKNIDMIISILSCMMAKKCYIPIDVFTPKERINSIINELDDAVIINNSEQELNNSIKLCNIDNLNDGTSDNDICYIIFTSGSTGVPKGVQITYSNLNNFVQYMIKFNKGYWGCNILNTASFSFDLSVADIFFSLCTGGTLYSLDDYSDLKKNYNFIKNNSINYIVATPTFAKLLFLDKEFESNKFSSLKSIYFCGETLSSSLTKKIFERFNDIIIINAYGPTEACCAISMIKIENDDKDPLPVGIEDNLATNVEIEKEEIVLSGKSLFKGYLNKNEKKDKYYTGDIGYFKNGLLYCVGRKDSQIKLNGYRIELLDVENNLKKCRNVIDAVVVAKKDNGVVKYLKAYVVSNNFDIEAIKKDLKAYLPKYMIPKIIVKIDKIPFTNNNKIDRKMLEND